MDKVNSSVEADAATQGAGLCEVGSKRSGREATSYEASREPHYNGGSDVVSMDDFQFNASLDALLDGDALDDGKPAAVSFQPAYAGQGARATISVAPPQGLLTTGTVGTSINSGFSSLGGYSRSSVPLSATANSFMGTAATSSVVAYGQSSASTLPRPETLVGVGSQHRQQEQEDPSSSLRFSGALPAARIKQLGGSETHLSNAPPRKRAATEVSDDEEDRDRRRHDRNLREQQRSHKITQQISELRDVLAAANIQFKPDKYSTLVTVSEYIKQLQSKSTLLDSEHKKLIATIAKTNEVITNQYVPASATGENPPGKHLDMLVSNDMGVSEEGDAMVFVRGIDYKCIFSKCGVALAVASIDGRFLDCNKEFERLTGYMREELLPCEKFGAGEKTAGVKKSSAEQRNLSLFNLLIRDDMEEVFVAMSEMLKHPPGVGSYDHLEVPALLDRKDSWAGTVRISRVPEISVGSFDVLKRFVILSVPHMHFFRLFYQIRMNISLVRSLQGRAKFFDCTLTVATDSHQD